MVHQERLQIPIGGWVWFPSLESEQAVTALTVHYGRSEAVFGFSEFWNLPLGIMEPRSAM